MATDAPTPLSEQEQAAIIRAWTAKRRLLKRLRYVWAVVALTLIGLGVTFDLLERPFVVLGVALPIGLLFAFIQARYSRCPRCHQDPGPRVRFHAPAHVQRGAKDIERWENCASCGVTLLDEATIAELRQRRFGGGKAR